MRASPLRRLIALFGLVAMAPLGFMLATGELAPGDAGIRAGIVFGVVFLTVRIGDAVLSGLAGLFEQKRALSPSSAEESTE